MPRLYYTPGACSLAAHIILEESGLPFESIAIDLSKGEQFKPEYLAIHPLGRVPALIADDGTVITENTAILPYLGKKFGLWPQQTAEQEAKALELVGYFASGVHVACSLIGRPGRYTDDANAHPGIQAKGIQTVQAHLNRINELLKEKEYFFDEFSVIDAYGFLFYLWGKKRGLDTSDLPDYHQFFERVLARPATQRALLNEGIDPSSLTTHSNH
jgi:glutathione S-transferase